MLQANIKLMRSNQEINYKQRLNLTRYKFTSEHFVAYSQENDEKVLIFGRGGSFVDIRSQMPLKFFEAC